VVLDRRHILGQIPEGIATETSGMGRQHRRGQHTGLQSASGQDGQSHGQGALAYTGNILNGEDFLIRHKISFLFFQFWQYLTKNLVIKKLSE
jgi:hypothetical protein